MFGWWDKVVNLAIRPPRAQYLLDELPGPYFGIRGVRYCRQEVNVANQGGLNLICSHYMPADRRGEKLPCVIYLHGNSGCQRDGCEILKVLLPQNITVFAFDFSGSGLSDGEYITLGITECEDLLSVINHLRSDAAVSKIALWGRSMGAATAVLCSQRDPSIAGIVCDSPYSRLNDLLVELCERYATENSLWLPKSMISLAVSFFRRSVKQQTGADIDKLDIMGAAASCFTPACFGHATGDTFVPIHHTERIHEAFAGDKRLLRFPGEHNGLRPAFFYDSASIFLHNVLEPPDVVAARPPPHQQLGEESRWLAAPTTDGEDSDETPRQGIAPIFSRTDLSNLMGEVLREQEGHELDPAEAGHAATVPTAVGDRRGSRHAVSQEDLETLVNMGFSKKAAARALKRHRNMDMAVNFLLEIGETGLDDSSEDEGAPAESARQTRPDDQPTEGPSAAGSSLPPGGAAEGMLPLPQLTQSNPWPNRGNPERQLPPLMRDEREQALQPAVPVTNPDSDPARTNTSTEEYLQIMQNAEDQELARAIQLSLQGT